jgi:hypothetical protein
LLEVSHRSWSFEKMGLQLARALQLALELVKGSFDSFQQVLVLVQVLVQVLVLV